jgi:hypothetical protein
VTAVAPGIDRGRDRRDAPREPERPEPDTTPRDARWAALLDGLPDAFIEPDATPESIAELRRRLGMPAVDWPEPRPAEPADPDRVARRLRELEAEGHGPQRHEGQVTDQQLRDRVLHGHDPAQQGPDKTVDAVTGGPHRRPELACRFNSPEAMVAADDAVRSSPEFEARRSTAEATGLDAIAVRVPLERALGPSWRTEVAGVEAVGPRVQPAGVHAVDFTGGQVQAVCYCDDPAGGWKTLTIYPDKRQPQDEVMPA